MSIMPHSKAKCRAFNKRFLRHAQFYLLFAIGHWLRDSGDNAITDYDAEVIVTRYYKCKVVSPRFSALLRDLRDPNHTLYKSISIIMMEPRHREFFGNNALELYTEYLTRRGFPAPHLDIPT